MQILLTNHQQEVPLSQSQRRPVANTENRSSLWQYLPERFWYFYLTIISLQLLTLGKKVKIKGARKISMELSEFEEGLMPMSRTVPTSIVRYNCKFDFENLILIKGKTDQQLMVLDKMHASMFKIAEDHGWDKNIFIEVYRQTHENIIDNSTPQEFWNVKF